MHTEAIRFSKSLKSIARDQHVKAYIQNSKELYPLLVKGAQRFVAGETRPDGIARVKQTFQAGHEASIEFIGENTTSEEACKSAVQEFSELIKDLGIHDLQATVSFDLSHIGMMISDEMAFTHLERLAKEAGKNDVQLMISMEESQKTDAILSLYKRAAASFTNVGITLQLQLKRSAGDLEELLQYPGRIRLVKGAYEEPDDIHIPRSKALNERYIEFAAACVERDHPLSIATHDENLLLALKSKGLLHQPNVEVEMLDGVRHDLLNALREEKIRTKVYATYGTEWYLYVVHRIAEHPPNIYTFLSDIIDGGN
ncbi:UNVERIFIED_CONTAM: proline dehydrogenase family protein [Halobacillus marinus]